MPRVRNNNAAHSAISLTSSVNSPSRATKIPLNDDASERQQRKQQRQALHSQQINQLKAAAATTPQRKRRSMGFGQDSPSSPGQDGGVRGQHVTPIKRAAPILANFEEWIKIATDNKINATNSWNFALIDYFYDMSLLKDGDGVNFQKASCTLDGCVKIYTSRVDSVATETGKLLSGLADSGNKKRKDAEEGAEDGDEDEENEDGTKKKTRKKTQRSAEATLVTSFELLRLKKMELEFSVDPLFKKASADFDEGGAKGLLLNHLSIDNAGRIVFDSSDDAHDIETEDSRRDSMEPESERDIENKEAESIVEDGPVDISALGARFFPDLDRLDEQDICPTLKTFELGGGDGSLDLPFLKAPENWRDDHPEMEAEQPIDQTGIDLNDQAAPFAGDDDDDAGALAFDVGLDVGFGEGGEAWARDAALQPQMRVYNSTTGADPSDEAAGEIGVFDTHSNSYGVTLQHRSDHDQDNILKYFDNTLQKNWAGPEHWKIARIKEANKEGPKRTRKEKEPFEIDFMSPMSQELANALYITATNNSTISIPKKEWKSRTRNLLPDDKHFNSKDLLKLFLKPKARLGARKSGQSGKQPYFLPNGDVDEAYWASHNVGPTQPHPMDDDAGHGNYDADFFQDDGLPMAGGVLDDDDDDFADARETFSPGVDESGVTGRPMGAGIDSVTGPSDSSAAGDAFGANLVAQSRRMRPEYVQYARVAKKVDMRRLKAEMWRGIGFEHRSENGTPPKQPSMPALSLDDKAELKFTDVMNNLQHVYPKQQMSDISTSFGFICLLHLANEKGLVIENVDGWTDLSIRKDFTALELDGGD